MRLYAAAAHHWPSLAAGLIGAFYCWSALPGVHWHDTGEFLAAGRTLSLSHPPGHPLALQLIHLCQLIPLGDLALRGNWMSALCAALAALALGRTLRLLPLPKAPPLAAALFLCWLFVLPPVWLQGCRVEVYMLQAMLGAVALALLCRAQQSDDLRLFPLLGLSLGLMGANHTLLAAAWLPPVTLWLLLRRPPLRALIAVAGGGLFGLSLYLFLPLRGASTSPFGWGEIQNLEQLWDFISAKIWRDSVTARMETLSWAENGARLLRWAFDRFGPWASALALTLSLTTPLTYLRRWRGGERDPLRDELSLVLLCVGLCLCTLATKFSYPFNADNPDFEGYLCAALAPAGVLLWTGLSALRLELRGGRASWPLGSWLSLPLFLLALPRYDPGHRQGARSADMIARELLLEVPPGGALSTAHYAHYFAALSLQALEGLRPDVALPFQGFRGRPWAARRLAGLEPRWKSWLLEAEPSYPVGLYFDLPPRRRAQRGAPPLCAAGISLTPCGSEAHASSGSATLSRARFASIAASVRDLDGRHQLAYLHAHWALWATERGAEALRRFHLDEAERLLKSPLDLAALARALKWRAPTERDRD